MSFLVPLYFLGALAIGLPIYFHLRRRPPNERLRFSSLMFLRPSPQPRADRRSRPEHLGLLLLRCLALLLLALAFTRPFFRQDDSMAGGSGGAMVLLVDASASVGRTAGAWERAVESASDIVGKADGPVDLLVYDHRVREAMSSREAGAAADSEGVAVGPVDGDSEGAARLALAAFEPGDGPSDLGAALLAAAERLPDGGEVVVLSDFLEGARLEALRGLAWPENVAVRLEPIVDGAGTGFAAYWLPSTADGLPRIRLLNGPAATADAFRVAWSDAPGGPEEVIIPPGSARVVRLEEAGDAARTLRIERIGGDRIAPQLLSWVPPRTVEVRVYCPSDADDPMRFYLERALRGGGWRNFVISPPGADAGFLATADVAVVTAPLPPDAIAPIGEALRGGLPVVVALPSADARVAALLGALGGRPVGLSEAAADARSGNGYALLAKLDFRHPFLLPFAEAEVRDFSRVRVWRHRVLDGLPGEDPAGGGAAPAVVAEFDDGSPALVDAAVGDGRLVVLACGWHPDDSQLGLSSKFVPLLLSIFEATGAVPGDSSSFFGVGESVAPAVLANRPVADLVTPDGERIRCEAGDVRVLDQAGIHRIEPVGERAGEVIELAVNPPESESRLEPLPDSAFEEAGIGAALGGEVSTAAGPPESDNNEVRAAAAIEGRQQFWRWIVLALFVILIAEAIMSGWMSRRRAPQPAGA